MSSDDKDPVGNRMKGYEAVTRLVLPRKTHTIIRLDGNAFHTYTRGLPKPFDETLHTDLVSAAAFLCAKVSGARLAYVQSDEISLLLTDFENPGTQPWFGGNAQKITSVSASILTAKFNELRNLGMGELGEKLAFFDARVFVMDDPDEVIEYFIWRQRDSKRNSISALAHAHFSHRELQNRSSFEQQVMVSEKGHAWVDQDPRFKFGSILFKDQRTEDVTFTRNGVEYTAKDVTRTFWTTEPGHGNRLVAHLKPLLLR